MPFEPQVTGEIDGLRPQVMDKLLEVSRNTGKPVDIISGHDKRHGTSAHNYGLAADVTIPGYNSEQIAAELAKAGFNGVGVYRNKDGTPTNTAHGDIRGEPTAKGTPYYKEHGGPATWDGNDIGGGPGKRKWKYSKRDWRWTRGTRPEPEVQHEVKPSPAKVKAPALGKIMGKRAVPVIVAFFIFLAILFIVGPYLNSGGDGGGGAGNWEIYTDTGQQYATLYVDSSGNFTGEGWTGYAPGIGTYDIHIINGVMSGTSMTFDTYASYGSGTITGSYYGTLDAPFPAATSASYTGSGTISDPLGDRGFNDSGTATRS